MVQLLRGYPEPRISHIGRGIYAQKDLGAREAHKANAISNTDPNTEPGPATGTEPTIGF